MSKSSVPNLAADKAVGSPSANIGGSSHSETSPSKNTRNPEDAPEIQLEHIRHGPAMKAIGEERGQVIVSMLSRTMYLEGEMGKTPTAAEMEDLAVQCDAMAQAETDAIKRVGILKSTTPKTPYGSVPVGALKASSTTPAPWGNFDSLPRLDPSGAAQVHIPIEYIAALTNKVYLPLNMFTYDHLTKEAPQIDTEKYTHPLTLAKIVVPKTKPFLSAEYDLPKAQWDGAWRRYIDAIEEASGDTQFADMFRRWHQICRNHSFYERDDMFPVLRQFDIDKRKLFFHRRDGFVLDESLLSGPEGIVSFAADYSIQQQREAIKLNEASIAAMNAKLSTTCSSGPERSPRRFTRPQPFPAGNRTLSANPDCCARCGRKGHQARRCHESTLAKGGSPILCDFRDGRFFTRANNEERCFRFNSGLHCNSTDHAAAGKHKCTLCGSDAHCAVQCSRAE
ncbi:hypothetical protein DL93DRAFT_154412 [Clavulina sp. PMI_390]|nr:hypothetical protein DL93DRAFT_154412 [Clavulina sp. PMI_390]